MDAQVAPLYEMLKIDTRLFENSLDGVDDQRAQIQPSDGANNMVFIALHLLDARAYLARYIGIEYQHPFTDLEAVRSIDEMPSFPPVTPVRAAWRQVSDLLLERFPMLSADELSQESAQEFPVEDRTVSGGIAFLLLHESFHIGQIAYLRRCVGLAPMSYT